MAHDELIHEQHAQIIRHVEGMPSTHTRVVALQLFVRGLLLNDPTDPNLAVVADCLRVIEQQIHAETAQRILDGIEGLSADPDQEPDGGRN